MLFVWVLRPAGGVGLLENIVLYYGFVFRCGWVRGCHDISSGVYDHRVVWTQGYMNTGLYEHRVMWLCVCQVWVATVSYVFRNSPRWKNRIPSEFSLFSQKYFVQNWLISKVWILGNRTFMLQRQNRRKYFVQNGRRQEWTRDFDPPFLDIFLDIYKCPFCPLRVEVLKTWNTNTQKMSLWPLCSQNVFSTLKNCDWIFLGGSAAASKSEG